MRKISLLTVLQLVLFIVPHGMAQNSPEELVLTEFEQKQILQFARDSSHPLSAGIKKIHSPVILITFHEDGRLLDSIRIDDDNIFLPEKIRKGMTQLKPTESAYLHVMIVSYTARFPNFGITGLFDNPVFEPKMTGIAYELDGKRAEMNPIEQWIANKGPHGVRAHLAKKIGFDAKKMPEQNDLVIEIYRVIHFGERYPDKKFASFYRGHLFITPEEVNHDLLADRLEQIGEWYSNNVIDGQVTYEYHPATGKYQNEGRTMIRSTMSAWILNRLAYFLNDSNLKNLGQETMEFYLKNYFNGAESSASGRLIPSDAPLASGDRVKNRYTTASFIVAAILERDDWKKYFREINLLIDWVMSFQKEDGIFKMQYAQDQYFIPGQLLLAVSYLYEKTGDEKLRKFFEKSWNAYEPALLSMMHLGDELYTPYAPAWFTQPAAKMYQLTKESRYRDFVFAINDRVAKWYGHHQAHQVYKDYDGILAPKRGSFGNTSITAASLESLVDATIVAKLTGDADRFKKYQNVIRSAVAYLLRLQYIPENTYSIQNRERVSGALRKDIQNSTVWMDNVWHATSAFIKIQQYGLLE